MVGFGVSGALAALAVSLVSRLPLPARLRAVVGVALGGFGGACLLLLAAMSAYTLRGKYRQRDGLLA